MCCGVVPRVQSKTPGLGHSILYIYTCMLLYRKEGSFDNNNNGGAICLTEIPDATNEYQRKIIHLQYTVHHKIHEKIKPVGVQI